MDEVELERILTRQPHITKQNADCFLWRIEPLDLDIDINRQRENYVRLSRTIIHKREMADSTLPCLSPCRRVISQLDKAEKSYL
jgi:hypothetical protein